MSKRNLWPGNNRRLSAGRAARNGVGELSARENEVLSLVVRGLTNKQISAALAIVEITVKNHVSKILAKLRAANRTQASAIALQQGIIQFEDLPRRSGSRPDRRK